MRPPAPGPGTPLVRVFDCHVARCAPDGQWQFLLLQRAPDRVYAHTWRMVSGKLQPGETAWQACLRELQEETGLLPTRLLAVPFVSHFYEWQQDTINSIPVFAAVVPFPSATIRLDSEHTASDWLLPTAALARLAWPTHRAGLEATHSLLTSPNSSQDPFQISCPMPSR